MLRGSILQFSTGVVREALIKKLTWEQRFKGREGRSHSYSWRKKIFQAKGTAGAKALWQERTRWLDEGGEQEEMNFKKVRVKEAQVRWGLGGLWLLFERAGSHGSFEQRRT